MRALRGLGWVIGGVFCIETRCFFSNICKTRCFFNYNYKPKYLFILKASYNNVFLCQANSLFLIFKHSLGQFIFVDKIPGPLSDIQKYSICLRTMTCNQPSHLIHRVASYNQHRLIGTNSNPGPRWVCGKEVKGTNL